MLLQPVLGLVDFLVRNENSRTYIAQLKDAAFARMTQLHAPSQENKEQKALFREVGGLVRDIVAMLFTEDELEWILEEFNLDIGLAYVQQQSIDKRLKGLRWLRRPLGNVTAKERKGFSLGQFARKALIGIDPSIDGDEAARRLLPAEKVVAWLVDKRLPELLPTLVDYPELVRQGMPLVVFVADRAPERLAIEPICALWKGTLGKHEADKRTILEAIRTLLPFLPLPMLDRLWADVAPLLLSVKNVDVATLDFVSAFTAEALAKSSYEAAAGGSSQPQRFGGAELPTAAAARSTARRRAPTSRALRRRRALASDLRRRGGEQARRDHRARADAAERAAAPAVRGAAAPAADAAVSQVAALARVGAGGAASAARHARDVSDEQEEGEAHARLNDRAARHRGRADAHFL
jgi:hypothetical protein